MRDMAANKEKWFGTYAQQSIELSEEFIAALKHLVECELRMMQQLDAECWQWGMVTISDLATGDCLGFQFGSNEDRDPGIPAGASVWVEDDDGAVRRIV